MDAYDIFKKLTKGAKFKKQKPNVNIVKVTSVITSNLPEENAPIKLENEERNVVANAEEVNNITLLGTIVAEQNPKRGKKRKKSLEANDDDASKRLKALEQEETNRFRNVNQIKTIGSHVADPVKNFRDLNVKPDLIDNLLKCGYVEPTAVQKQAVPVMLEGRNILACAPTGSGKTAAFSVPLIDFLARHVKEKSGIRALIICPTRELAKQTQREFLRLAEGRAVKVHVINKVNNLLTQEKSKHLQKYDVLVTTPNRLCFLLKQDQPLVSLGSVQWLIIDEADKLFETGTNGFREQLEQIMSSLNMKELKIGMFSATHTPIVAKWCRKNMKGLIRVTVGQRNAATNSVEQELLFVGNEAGKLIALRDVIRKGITPPILVFVQSKERAQQLFTELIYDGVNVAVIHANQTQLQRDNSVRSFREGKIWILICTDLMARGVDFKGVNLIINYDFPPTAIAYVHRIGRAGRAGRTGKALTFFTVSDTINLRSIAHVLKQSGCNVPDYMLALKKRSKTARKKIEMSAPKRDDIYVNPAAAKLKRKFALRDGKKKNGTTKGTKRSVTSKK